VPVDGGMWNDVGFRISCGRCVVNLLSFVFGRLVRRAKTSIESFVVCSRSILAS